jgi:hypothetical protein
MNRAERLNVIADEHFDIVRLQANGPRSARSSAILWDSETCALFIRGGANHEPHERKDHTTTTRLQPVIIPREERTLECIALLEY